MPWGEGVTVLLVVWTPDPSCCTFKCWFAADAAPISVRGFGGGLDLPTSSVERLVPSFDDTELFDIFDTTTIPFIYSELLIGMNKRKIKTMIVPFPGTQSQNTTIIRLSVKLANNRRRRNS